MSIMLRLLTLRVLPTVASLLLHVAAYGTILLAPGLKPRESVIVAELVPDPEPPAREKRPEPRKPERRPLTLPRPIETPMPKVADKPVETETLEPTPPAPVLPAPAPVAEPAGPAGRGPLAPVDAPIATAGEGLPTQSGPPALARPAPTVAALPPDGITQTAAPRGG